ncbi:MAG: SDR family oxidoreductase [Rubrivivax sp.]|nr:SDR family oxidoreductase [Rubrivivax sp.]
MRAVEARVLLTGASGGIGQAMGQTLRQAGAQVMGVGRAAAPTPAGTDWVQADLTTAAGQAAVGEAAAAWGANVLVHAAGLPCFGLLGAVPPAQVQAVLQANLLAPMLLTQQLLPQLLRQRRAQIVFVGSALGRIGLPGFSVYGASKAGLHGFAEALRRELNGTPVRVQILGPRSTRTGFNDATVEAYNRATGTAMDQPEAVAAALLQLIESEAAERFLGFPERLAVRLNGVLGALLDGSFVKHRRSLPAVPLQPASQGTPS